MARPYQERTWDSAEQYEKLKQYIIPLSNGYMADEGETMEYVTCRYGRTSVHIWLNRDSEKRGKMSGLRVSAKTQTLAANRLEDIIRKAGIEDTKK